ncbi:hypothetical protein KGQ24_00450 [Patescibacteria group bacterium]|nr:hypothetical protein [Patescibacteria group bacterium]
MDAQPHGLSYEPSRLAPLWNGIGQAFLFYRKYFWKLIGIEMVPFLIMAAALVMAVVVKNSIFALIAYAIGLLLVLLAQLAVIFLVKHNDPSLGVFKIYNIALSRFLSFLWLDIFNAAITFCVGIIIASLTGFLILFLTRLINLGAIGGIIYVIATVIGILIYIGYVTRFSLAVYVFADQDVRGSAAVLASKDYVKGIFWPYFWRFSTVILLAAIISFLLGLIGKMSPQVSAVISALYSFLLVPFLSVYFFLLYLNLKAIKSGYHPVIPAKRRLKLWSLIIFAIAAVIAWYLYLGNSIGFDLVKYMLINRLNPTPVQQTQQSSGYGNLPSIQVAPPPQALPDNYR